MMKRVTILCGHYGAGKTNIAVSLALGLAKEAKEPVAIADLDIVNPYFRTLDSKEELEAAGIRMICSAYANSNLDIPALPPDLYTITDDRSQKVILDIGGDDRGAYVLGRLVPGLTEENDYDLWCVINQYRPLTPDVPSTLEVLHEIEAACGIRFTGIVNNSNLGELTTPEDVAASVPYARAVAEAAGIPLVLTSVRAGLLEGCDKEALGIDTPVLEMQLQKKYWK